MSAYGGVFFFFQAEDGIRDVAVTGVQTCALPISLSAVSGRALTNGCITSGNRAYEKNVPDSIHIGSITRFMSPETASMVRARLATSMPSPLNDRAPSTVMNVSAPTEPRTPTSNIHHANPTSAATSTNRNARRDSTNDSK